MIFDARLMPLSSLASELMHDQDPEVRWDAAALLDALPVTPKDPEELIAVLESDDPERWRMIPDELPEGGSDALFEAVAWRVADEDQRVAEQAQRFVVRAIEQMSAHRDPALLRRALRLRRIARSLDVWSYRGLPGRVASALADAGIEIGDVPRSPRRPATERHLTFIWRRSGSSYGVYDALVQRPEPGNDTGYAVMLFGSGLTSDLHWTVPGSVDTGEGARKLTLDGEPTRDADTLARALVDAGFTVLRYSCVFEGNPRFTPDPAMRAPAGFEDSVSLARAAIEGFRREREIPAGGLILLGHSLGATRACLMEDKDIAGFVLLAPAYMSKTAARPSVLSGEALSRHRDRDIEEAVRLSPEMAAADRDGDGVYRGWELAAWDRSRGAIESESATWRGGLGWPSDRLIARGVPTLALFGGLDPTSVHGPWLEAATADGRLPDCRVLYFTNRGHNLAREVEGRTGHRSRGHRGCDPVARREVRRRGVTAGRDRLDGATRGRAVPVT